MKKKIILATTSALLAAILYAINIPLSKILLRDVSPTMQASFLYLGAGIGIGFIFLFSKKSNTNEKIRKNDLKYIIGMVLLDILAPILMMYGLKQSLSSSATLLNNFEIVATASFAIILFHEKVNPRMWIAIILITIASFILSFSDLKNFQLSLGSFFIILATICWGLENNCTRMLANKNVFQIIMIKGIGSGIGSLGIAFLLKEDIPYIKFIVLSLLLGFVAYGLSIFFYIKAQGTIGATKTSAYYAINPFIGVLLSFIILNEKLDVYFFIALFVMIMGTVLVIIDTLKNNNET